MIISGTSVENCTMLTTRIFFGGLPVLLSDLFDALLHLRIPRGWRHLLHIACLDLVLPPPLNPQRSEQFVLDLRRLLRRVYVGGGFAQRGVGEDGGGGEEEGEEGGPKAAEEVKHEEGGGGQGDEKLAA